MRFLFKDKLYKYINYSSYKMIEEIRTDNNCIVKVFENNPIAILQENVNNKKVYYFKASDIGKVLGIVNIRSSIMNFDDDEKVVRTTYSSHGGNQETLYLTSQGVYRLLYNSKKEIAKKFRKWAGNILDDIIFNESAELKRQLDLQKKEFIQDKQEILLTSYNQKCIVYIIKINDTLFKFGNTDNIKRRLTEHRREINQNIELIYCIESKNNTLLENKLKDYLKITNFRKEQIINNKNQTELIEISDISTIKNKLEQLNSEVEKCIMNYELKIKSLEEELQKYKEKANKYFNITLYQDFIQNYCEVTNNHQDRISTENLMIEFHKSLKNTDVEDKINNLYNKEKYKEISYYYKLDYKLEFVKNLTNILNIEPSRHYFYKNSKKIPKMGFLGIQFKKIIIKHVIDNNIYINYFNDKIEKTIEKKKDTIKLSAKDILLDFVKYIKNNNIKLDINLLDNTNKINYGLNYSFKQEFLNTFKRHFNIKQVRYIENNINKRGFYNIKLKL